MQQESKKLFREKALNKAFAADELDKMMRVTKPTGWLALLVMGIIICGAIIWGILGSISIKVAAEGILLDDNSTGMQKAVLFLPMTEKDRVQPQMTVQIALAGFPPQGYGYLLGTVREISKYPATSQNLMDIMKNEALVTLFSGAVSNVMVTVDLQRDSGTGGYIWTDPAGQAVKISSATLCQGNIIVAEKRPVALLLPR